MGHFESSSGGGLVNRCSEVLIDEAVQARFLDDLVNADKSAGAVDVSDGPLGLTWPGHPPQHLVHPIGVCLQTMRCLYTAACTQQEGLVRGLGARGKGAHRRRTIRRLKVNAGRRL